jgi:hypothetical protein
MNKILNQFIRNRHPEEAKKYKSQEITAQAETNEINPKLIQVFRHDAGKAIVTLRETAANSDFDGTAEMLENFN